MRNARALSAFLFYHRNRDDPNCELTWEQTEQYEREGIQFLAACEALLGALKSQQYTEQLDVQTLFYDIGKQFYGEDKKQLLVWFSSLYLLLFEAPHGPRWGQFVFLFGQENFVARLERQLRNPLALPNLG